MTPRPAVVDTNVVVAGLLTADADAPTARILEGMVRGRFPFVLSPALLTEYRVVLSRERIRELHRLTAAQVDDVLTAIVANAIVREGTSTPTTDPDPGDQHLWELLASTPAAILVTGDSALRDHAPAGVSAISPRAWVECMAG